MRQGKDIINRYNTYLRLEKSLSANSIDAYLTDLDKLLRFAEDEKKDVKEISYDDLQQFIAQLRDIGSRAICNNGFSSFRCYNTTNHGYGNGNEFLDFFRV